MTLVMVWTLGAIVAAVSFHRTLVKQGADLHTLGGAITYALMVLAWPAIIAFFVVKVAVYYLRRKD